MRKRLRRLLLAGILGAVPLLALDSPLARSAVSEVRAPRCVFDHNTLWTAHGTCRPHAKVYPPSVTGIARRAIYDSVLTFGIPYWIMLRIASCESGLDPAADNGANFGLYQFVPQTFFNGAHALYHATGIRAHSYWDALDSAYVAGYLFATGSSLWWGCR